MCLLIGFCYRKLIIELLFNDSIDYEWWICIFKKVTFNVSMSLGKEFKLLQVFYDLCKTLKI